MKHFYLLLPVLGLAMAMSGCGKNSVSRKSHITQDAALERRVDSLLAKLTLEEKVGQMAQYTLDVIASGGDLYSSGEPLDIDPAMLDTVVGKYKVGSILNTSNNRARTPEVWEKVIRTIQERALMETGIPVLYGIDSNHGTTYTAGGTYDSSNNDGKEVLGYMPAGVLANKAVALASPS